LRFPPVEFQGATFALIVVGGEDSGSPGLGGWVTLPNNETYHFGILGDPLGPPSVNWTPPDHSVIVEWNAPFLIASANGPSNSDVIYGVVTVAQP